MVAFEISINGKPLPPMECPGFGHLHASIGWSRIRETYGGIHEHAYMFRNGTKKGLDTETLPFDELKIGDEITIRIVGTPAPPRATSTDILSN